MHAKVAILDKERAAWEQQRQAPFLRPKQSKLSLRRDSGLFRSARHDGASAMFSHQRAPRRSSLNSLSAAYPQSPFSGFVWCPRYLLRTNPQALSAGLVEDAAAGFAQAGPVAPQARGDGADIGDFAGVESVDVRRAGPALLRRPLRVAVEANNVRNSPTVEARRARLFTSANRKNLVFMTALPFCALRLHSPVSDERVARNKPARM